MHERLCCSRLLCETEEHRANSLALQQDAFAAYCSALAYRLSGKKRYGEKACYFMNAWATINKKYSEPDGPLVMSYSGSAFLMAAELMDDTSVWDADEKQLFKDWVTSVYRKATNKFVNGRIIGLIGDVWALC